MGGIAQEAEGLGNGGTENFQGAQKICLMPAEIESLTSFSPTYLQQIERAFTPANSEMTDLATNSEISELTDA